MIPACGVCRAEPPGSGILAGPAAFQTFRPACRDSSSRRAASLRLSLSSCMASDGKSASSGPFTEADTSAPPSSGPATKNGNARSRTPRSDGRRYTAGVERVPVCLRCLVHMPHHAPTEHIKYSLQHYIILIKIRSHILYLYYFLNTSLKSGQTVLPHGTADDFYKFSLK